MGTAGAGGAAARAATPAEPVILTGGSTYTGVGASPLPGEQMFSRML
ncbi:hypothetical protein AB0J01_28425 [Streptomyces sp. NPDC050204]